MIALEDELPTRPHAALGRFIRALRVRREIPLREFALMVGVSHVTMADIERGLVEPTPTMLDAIMVALDGDLRRKP